MLLLHEGMKLHPIGVAICFLLFGLMSLKVMFNMFKQGNKGLGGFMFVTSVVFLFSAYLSSQVHS